MPIRQVLVSALLAGLAANLISATPSVAQNALITNAQNANQLSVANNIIGPNGICPTLVAQAGSLTGDTKDLQLRCTAAVTSPNNQPGSAEIVLGQISPEEILAQDAVVSGTIQPQSQAVTARLSAMDRRMRGLQLGAQSIGFDKPVALASTEPWQVLADSSGVSAFNVSGLGVFLSGSGSFGDKDQTTLESGYDFHSYSITAGVDYFFQKNLAAGIAFGYTGSGVDFDNNGGDLDADGFNFALYSLWNPLDALGLTALISYGRINYDSTRNINYTEQNPQVTISRTAKGDTDANQLEFSGSANYDFTSGPITYGPTARISFLYQDVDGFSESGAQGLNLVYDSRSSESFQTALGAAATYALSTGFGVATLQARAEWVHEYLDDSDVFGVRYVNDNIAGSTGFSLTTEAPDRDRFLLGGGGSMVFEGGLSAFADFETVVGLSDVTAYTFTAGVRKEF